MSVKPLAKRGYQALFKCNKCSTEWEAHSTVKIKKILFNTTCS